MRIHTKGKRCGSDTVLTKHLITTCLEASSSSRVTIVLCSLWHQISEHLLIYNVSFLCACCNDSHWWATPKGRIITLVIYKLRNGHNLIIMRLLRLLSLFVAWFFWTFHNKSHNMKALVILSHSWPSFLRLTCLYEEEKRTFVDPCASFWSIFSRKNSPQIAVLI